MLKAPAKQLPYSASRIWVEAEEPRLMAALTQDVVYQKVSTVRDTLRKYTDYNELFEEPEENPLEKDLEGFCTKLHQLMKDQYQGVKDAVQAEYSRENVTKYTGILQHNLEYVKRRFDSETVVDDGKLYFGLLEIVRTFLESHLYDINEELFWILFDQFPDARSWANEYVRNYAIIVTHTILLGPINVVLPAPISLSATLRT
jgi:hypothetical protein